MSSSARGVAENFEAAAFSYDAAATAQAQIASRLIGWAAESAGAPRSLLDLGCGTGFAAAAAAKKYPRAALAAFDASPAMLRAARRRLPRLTTIDGDAAGDLPEARFDMIVSSLMLHWLPDPRAVMKRWCKALKPGGHFYAAVLVEGSFAEWRDLCRAQGVADGLWKFPAEDAFADDPAPRRQLLFPLTLRYPAAHDFLRTLKATGAATPRADYRPLGTPALRRLIRESERPFPVTYRVLFLERVADA